MYALHPAPNLQAITGIASDVLRHVDRGGVAKLGAIVNQRGTSIRSHNSNFVFAHRHPPIMLANSISRQNLEQPAADSRGKFSRRTPNGGRPSVHGTFPHTLFRKGAYGAPRAGARHMSSDVSTTTFRCPKCHQRGAALWETVGGEASLVSISDQFYERVQKKRRSQLEIVCGKCGAVVPPVVTSGKAP